LQTKTIKLKRRIEKFFEDEDKELAFALYVDIDGLVHFKYCNCDIDMYQLSEYEFYKEFSLVES